MVELVDTTALGAVAERCGGSSPLRVTNSEAERRDTSQGNCRPNGCGGSSPSSPTNIFNLGIGGIGKRNSKKKPFNIIL